jgi:hypothetical protein
MQAAGYGLTRSYLAHTRINKLTLRSPAGSSKGIAPAHLRFLKRRVNQRIPGILRNTNMLKTIRINHKIVTMKRIKPSDLLVSQILDRMIPLRLTVSGWSSAHVVDFGDLLQGEVRRSRAEGMILRRRHRAS